VGPEERRRITDTCTEERRRIHVQKRRGGGGGGGGKKEEDLFAFNDTIEGPKAPAVKAGHVTQACREWELLPCLRW